MILPEYCRYASEVSGNLAIFIFFPFTVSDEAAVRHLKELGPSAVDTELRSLAPDMGGTVSVMQSFLRMISSMLKQKQDFDLAQAYLALFLKVCGFSYLSTKHPDLLKSPDYVITLTYNVVIPLLQSLIQNQYQVQVIFFPT